MGGCGHLFHSFLLIPFVCFSSMWIGFAFSWCLCSLLSLLSSRHSQTEAHFQTFWKRYISLFLSSLLVHLSPFNVDALCSVQSKLLRFISPKTFCLVITKSRFLSETSLFQKRLKVPFWRSSLFPHVSMCDRIQNVFVPRHHFPALHVLWVCRMSAICLYFCCFSLLLQERWRNTVS